MDTSLVSAIITTHNRPPRMVLRAVNSVLNQTYPNIEIIVVDDSDSDFPQRTEVERAVRKASDKIQYIKHEENRGGCAARNTGLARARGYYIAFLDDDDEWFPCKIEEQIKGFINKNIALVYCTGYKIDETRWEKNIEITQFCRGMVFNELLRINFIGGTSNPLIKKECIEKVGGFDERMESSQDYDLWLRISQRYPVNYIKKPLLNYYLHEGEQITTNANKKIAGIERNNRKFSEYINRDKKAWYLHHISIVPYYLKVYGRKKAFSQWLKCIQYQPASVVDNLKHLILIILGDEHYSAITSRIRRITGRAGSV